MTFSSPKAALPQSCVGWWDSFIGLVVIMALFFALRFHDEFNNAQFGLILIGGVSAILGLIELTRAPWRQRAPSHENMRAIIRRASVKFLGLMASMAFIGFLYWVFPDYRRDLYTPYFEVLFLVAPYVPPLMAVYLLYAEWRFPEARDSSWQAGMFVLGRWDEIDWYKFHQNLMGWLIKGYFLAAMFGDLAHGMAKFRTENWNLWELPFLHAFGILFSASVTLELVFVTAGYFWGCRLFNTQLRTAEDTVLGWAATVICYGPFLSLTFQNYLGYRSGHDWQSWMSGHEILQIIWGSIILILMIVHTWCDACFGLHFSNLTNRGIITNGCYRFCKHPAYLIKNIRWWMVSVPFVGSQNWDTNLRLSLLLVGVNLVYTWRCWVEERLLSRDPTYIAYALWMEEHGWMRWVGNIAPFMKYSHRLERWRTTHALKPMPTHYEIET